MQGPVSLTVFPSQFKFDGNYISLSSRFQYSDRYKILYMARQLCCRGMCKICCDLMASNGITARRSFHRIWIAGKKLLVKRAPGPRYNGTQLDMAGFVNRNLYSCSVIICMWAFFIPLAVIHALWLFYTLKNVTQLINVNLRENLKVEIMFNFSQMPCAKVFFCNVYYIFVLVKLFSSHFIIPVIWKVINVEM